MAASGALQPVAGHAADGRRCPFCDTRYGARGVEFCRSGQLAPSGAIRPRVRSGRIVTTLLLTAGTLKAITGWVRPLRVNAPSCSVFDASFERRVDALAEQDFSGARGWRWRRGWDGWGSRW